MSAMLLLLFCVAAGLVLRQSGQLADSAPALAREVSAHRGLTKLARQRLLCEFDRAHWHKWFENAGCAVSRKLDVVLIDDSHSLHRAAVDGHGVALFFRGLLQDELRSGQLVQLLDVSVDPGAAYYFIRPKGKPIGAKLTAFQRWLMDEVRRSRLLESTPPDDREPLISVHEVTLVDCRFDITTFIVRSRTSVGLNSTISAPV